MVKYRLLIAYEVQRLNKSNPIAKFLPLSEPVTAMVATTFKNKNCSVCPLSVVFTGNAAQKKWEVLWSRNLRIAGLDS